MQDWTTMTNPNISWRTEKSFYFMSKYKKRKKEREKKSKTNQHKQHLRAISGRSVSTWELSRKTRRLHRNCFFAPFAFCDHTSRITRGHLSWPKKETKEKQTHQTGYILLDPQPRLAGLVRVCSDWLCLFLRAESPGSSDLVWAPEPADKGTREHLSRLLETQHWLTEGEKKIKITRACLWDSESSVGR